MINPLSLVPMVIETTGRGERAYDILFLAAQEPNYIFWVHLSTTRSPT